MMELILPIKVEVKGEGSFTPPVDLTTFGDVMDALPMEQLRDIIARPRRVSPYIFQCMAAWLHVRRLGEDATFIKAMLATTAPAAFCTLSEARRKLGEGGIKLHSPKAGGGVGGFWEGLS